MGFDDLARHMASRDGKATAPTSANDFIAQAAADNRRIARRNNLVLGTFLLVAGLIGTIAIVAWMIQAHSQGGSVRWIGGLFAAGAAVCVGAERLWRGLRNSDKE